MIQTCHSQRKPREPGRTFRSRTHGRSQCRVGKRTRADPGAGLPAWSSKMPGTKSKGLTHHGFGVPASPELALALLSPLAGAVGGKRSLGIGLMSILACFFSAVTISF